MQEIPAQASKRKSQVEAAMKLRAGLSLDSRRPNSMQPRIIEDVVGPEGLLKTLEFWAGLVALVQAHPQRVIQYRNALKAADSPTCFYHRSLAIDPVATAETLLRWRDFALNHGWAGKAGAQSPGRLADLADVETKVKDLAPCVGERVAALVPKLGPVKAAIDEILLMDARCDWPGAFQELFKGLDSAKVLVSESASDSVPAAPKDSDLGLLQRALAGSEQGKPLTLHGDGTLHLYRCRDTHASANALCHAIHKHPNHLLIAGGDAFLLGLAARDRGFADPGLGERSRWRPAHQLLPLALQIAWSPPSAEALLQYLTLPVGRFRSLRRAIAKRFIDLPGYDRDVWQEEINAFVTRRLQHDPQLNKVKLRKQIDAWLRVAVAGSRDKMKRDLAIELVDQVRDYWRSRFGALNPAAGQEIEASQFLAAYQVADAISAALRAWDDDNEITREQLDRLLDLGVDSGTARLDQPRQVSQLNCIERPEVARLSLNAPESLFWWRPSMAPEVPLPPFDETEQAALPWLPDQSDRERQRQAALRRALAPLLTTIRHATLIITDDSVDLLTLYLDQRLPKHVWRSLDSDLIEGSQSVMPLSPVTDLPLPTPQRWWHIGHAVDCPRQRESYTGLSSLALSPHDYVLHYVAGFSAGSIAGVPVDQRLKGNLAHRLIEAWFNNHPWNGTAPGQAIIDSWLDVKLDPMIEAKALPLAAPGKRAERLAFRETFAHALYRLLEHLAGAGAQAVQVENPLQCKLTNFELEGSVDLLVKIKGRFAIIDVKWGGEKARIAELKEGRYLQLATYAHLVNSQPSSRVVEVAYFILRSADLLAPSSRIFQKARVIKSEDPNVSPSTVWQCLIKTTQWRCDQLAKGEIEVTSSAAAPAQHSNPPAGCLLPPETAKNGDSNGYNTRRAAFKPIDLWRVLTGQIKE